MQHCGPSRLVLVALLATALAACANPAALVRVDGEPAGTHCPSGGNAVKTGVDDDGDEVLDDAEVDSTQYVCIGNGAAPVTLQVEEPPGAHCALGGVAVRSGLDGDGNGVLDDAEVTATAYVCRDASDLPLSRFDSEPAGSNCAAGGTAVRTGIDLDGDGALGATEVTAVRYLCDDVELTRIDVVPAGAACAAGGVVVEAGADRDGDGRLDDDEIAHGETVCGSVIVGDVEVYTQAQLDALRDVQAITGGLAIRTGGLVSAVELPALRAVGGDLEIRVGNGVQTISAPSLGTVGGQLAVGSLPALHELSLPALRQAGWVSIDDNHGLVSVSLPQLGQVRGAVEIRSNPLATLDLRALASVGDLRLRDLLVPVVSLPQLGSAASVVFFENHASSFLAPALRTVNGDLGIGLDDELAHLDLSSLTLVTARLTLRDMPALVSFDLPRLEQTGDELAIWNNATLERFTMPQLRHVQGGLGLAIDNNPVLASLVGLAALQSIDGTFYFQNNAVLDDLSQLSALTTVTVSLQIGNTQLSRVGMPALTTVGRDLVLGHINLGLANPRLERIDLPQLREVGSLVASSDPLLTRFDLPRLRVIWSSLQLWDVPGMRKCDLDAFLAGLGVTPGVVHLHGIDEAGSCE